MEDLFFLDDDEHLLNADTNVTQSISKNTLKLPQNETENQVGVTSVQCQESTDSSIYHNYPTPTESIPNSYETGHHNISDYIDPEEDPFVRGSLGSFTAKILTENSSLSDTTKWDEVIKSRFDTNDNNISSLQQCNFTQDLQSNENEEISSSVITNFLAPHTFQSKQNKETSSNHLSNEFMSLASNLQKQNDEIVNSFITNLTTEAKFPNEQNNTINHKQTQQFTVLRSILSKEPTIRPTSFPKTDNFSSCTDSYNRHAITDNFQLRDVYQLTPPADDTITLDDILDSEPVVNGPNQSLYVSTTESPFVGTEANAFETETIRDNAVGHQDFNRIFGSLPQLSTQQSNFQLSLSLSASSTPCLGLNQDDFSANSHDYLVGKSPKPFSQSHHPYIAADSYTSIPLHRQCNKPRRRRQRVPPREILRCRRVQVSNLKYLVDIFINILSLNVY